MHSLIVPPQPQPTEVDESLDPRELIDAALSRQDWIKLFARLCDTENVSAAALLLRFRFGPHASVQPPSETVQSRVGLTEWKQDEPQTTSGTADKVS